MINYETEKCNRKRIFGNHRKIAYCLHQIRKTIIRKWVKPKDPKTPLQMKQREKYADANKIWKEMTPDEKQIYRERAKGLGMSGYNLFVSEFTRETN